MGSSIYAIDFGTTNSLIARASHHAQSKIEHLSLDPFSKDPALFRTILYFPNKDKVFYGAQAISEFISHDLTGRFLRSFKKFLPQKSMIGTFVDDRPLNLETLVGIFLKELRSRANEKTGEDTTSVVLGRPARFSNDPALDQFAQDRLEQGARIAGFKHIEFCPEPVAAARAFRSELTREQVVLVGDFGGGTSDYSIVKLGPDTFKPEDVLAIGGVSVAGDAMDGQLMRKRISRHFGADVHYKVPFGSNTLTMPVSLMEKICSPAEISILRKRDTIEFFRNVKQWSLGKDDRKKMDQLFCLLEQQLGFSIFEAIETAKRALSAQDETELKFIYPENSRGRPDVDIEEKIERSAFEEMIEDPVTKITDALDETLKLAGINASQVDLICLTGGTAKLPAIRAAMSARFGEEKLRTHRHFTSIVEGLAERALEITH